MPNRCPHGMLAGLCVVPGCPHAERPTTRKIRSPRCRKCRSEKPDVRARHANQYYCDGCYGELETGREFQARTGRRVPLW